MRPAEIAHAIANEIAVENPTISAREVSARTTGFLIEALLYVVQSSTNNATSRKEALAIVRRAFGETI